MAARPHPQALGVPLMWEDPLLRKFCELLDLLEKFPELLEQEYALLPRISIDLRIFLTKFRSMLIEIRHCHSLDEPDVQTRDWPNRVRELAYDIDDSVDLFALRVHADGGWRKPSSASRFLIRWLICDPHNLTTLPANQDIADELEGLSWRVVELREQRVRYRRAHPSAPQPIDSRLTTHFVNPGDLVGLEGPVEEVAKMVMDTGDKAQLKFVSIVGMAGSGKTTLANAVYERLGGQNCFQCQAFVSVGQKRRPDMVSNTLKEMLSQLGDGRLESDQEIHQLIERLREILQNKRYLIVVDDLWNLEDWEYIKCCFVENNLGSRIITTTRKCAVAMDWSSPSSGCIYNIGLLSEPNSKALFYKRAFGNEHCCPQHFKDVSAKIMTKCAGLPLALVSVASMLAHKQSRDELEKVGSNLLWSSHADGLKQVLSLSYKDLPPYLRTCMLHLSIFPEYCEVEVERLMMLWIAEGFIAEARDRSVEETARNYLTELIGRNIVQPLHQKHDEFPRYCIVHPVIHDFIVCISVEQNFVTLVNVQDRNDSTDFVTLSAYFPNNKGTVRRLSLQSNSNRDQAAARNDSTDLSHARSITVFGQARVTPQLIDLKVVRVLDLQGCDCPVCPDGLSRLVLLRYLSLRGTDVSELPATIGKLRYLQFLDVSSTKVKELPPSIGELWCLETLDVRSTKVKELPPSILNLKNTLKALLVGAKGRINLVETATRMPEDIQNCRSLEKLGTIDLRELHASFVMALGGLNRLRVLKITWSSQQSTQRAYREALLSSIKKWSQLESLTIHCGFLCSMEFLDFMPNPPQRLKKFKVTAGIFVVVPRWIYGLEFLSFMQITVCKLGSDDLRILKDLPKLKCLILGLEFIPREAIVIENDRFNELTRFSVDCPVPWLTFRTGAMPKLTYLELKFCSGPASQKSVPSGINILRSLTKVVLCYNEKWCTNSSSVKMTVEAVKEEVSMHRNPIELVINDTIVNVQVEEVTEIHNEAERGGEAIDDVEVAGEGISKITISEIEEIEDDAEHGF